VLIHAEWTSVVESLSTVGWFVAAEAIDQSVADLLVPPEQIQWRLLSDEGVALQHGYGAYLPFRDASQAVRDVGSELIVRTNRAANDRGLPGIPPFNEVTWTRYPLGMGRITRHRDRSAYRGIVAVATLLGAATFRVYAHGDVIAEYETAPGHLVLLRGTGWPDLEAPRPSHEVDPPVGRERMIMTLRSNASGAGAG
jgi:hypothetical protein